MTWTGGGGVEARPEHHYFGDVVVMDPWKPRSGLHIEKASTFVSAATTPAIAVQRGNVQRPSRHATLPSFTRRCPTSVSTPPSPKGPGGSPTAFMPCQVDSCIISRVALTLRRSSREPPSLQDIRKRAQLLVIDDHAVPFMKLFERDGYHIQRWTKIENLSDLTERRFDLILLDLHGVAVKDSPAQQGLGVLKHVKETDPTQLVIAYSAQDWSPSASEFFAKADAVLDKTAQYIDYKATVDRLLTRRFSEGYFLAVMNQILGDTVALVPRAVPKALRALRRGNSSGLDAYLRSHIHDEVTVDRVLGVIGIGISLLA